MTTYYTHSSAAPVSQTRGTSSTMRAEFDLIAAGFSLVNADIATVAAAAGASLSVAENTIASASNGVTTIGGVSGNIVSITGVNSITSFGLTYTSPKFIRFTGALTIVASSTMVTPNGQNITTVAGDSCVAIPIGNPCTGWRIADYRRMSQNLIEDYAARWTGGSSTAGSIVVPVRATANRDAAPTGALLAFNSSTNQFEGYNGATWGAIGGGATGAGGDASFNENDELVTTSYTIGQGAMMSGVTVTIATPAVFTLANHGFVAGQPVRLTTTGALPTGLSTNAQYFVLYLTSSTFNLAATVGGSAIATSGTQSGVHSVGKSKNASMVGPLVVASGVSLVIPTGSRLVVL